MKENEFYLINLAIKSRLKKEVKELKKLYQATIDGDEALDFHSKCDGIPNTLVLIKSAENRRFGGFTTQIWESSDQKWKDDENAFLFCLDKKTIYPYKNDGKAISCSKYTGPIFGDGPNIFIGNCSLQGRNSDVNHSSGSYNFYEISNALSKSAHIDEYEVFQVILS